jgi:hypothetical protein
MDLKMTNTYNIPKKDNTIQMCVNDDMLTIL